MLTTENKTQIINDYKIHATDTGSVEVQIAMLSADIKKLTEHFKQFPKDYNSKRGLMLKVGRRSAFLKYMKRSNQARHAELVQRLGL